MPDNETEDDRWLIAVRDALDQAGQVPQSVREAAYAAFAWRSIDAELAELTYDSSMEAGSVGVRSQQAPLRSLTLASNTLTIELQIEPDLLLGQLIPPETASVTVIRQDGTQDSYEVDDGGCFAIEPTPATPFRIQVAGEFLVATDWITL